MLDRLGEPPLWVWARLYVALLRRAALAAGVSDISQKGERLVLKLAVFRPEGLAAVCGLPKYRRVLTLSAGEDPALTLRLSPGQNVLDTAMALVEDLRLAGTENSGTP